MAIETTCMTPGAVFTTHIQPEAIEVKVALPQSFLLTEDEAIQLEHTIHNAVELALAPMFARSTTRRSEC